MTSIHIYSPESTSGLQKNDLAPVLLAIIVPGTLQELAACTKERALTFYPGFLPTSGMYRPSLRAHTHPALPFPYSTPLPTAKLQQPYGAHLWDAGMIQS